MLKSREELIEEIEGLQIDFYTSMDRGDGPPGIQMVVNRRSNARLEQGVWRLGETTSVRRYGARRSRAYVSMWMVFDYAVELLRRRQRVTAREMYYCLASWFRSQDELTRAILDCTMVLRCERHQLNILPGTRGFVAGRLRVRLASGEWVDASAGGERGLSVPGDLDAVAGVDVRDARFVLVVEKDAVYYRLVKSHAFRHMPCVLVTACGFPDVATRALVRRMHTHAPGLPLLVLTDWNCAGISIALTYAAGSITRGLSAAETALPIRRVGVTKAQLTHADAWERTQLLGEHEQRRIRIMLAEPGLRPAYPELADELEAMLRRGRRAEIEALSGTDVATLPEVILRASLSTILNRP